MSRSRCPGMLPDDDPRSMECLLCHRDAYRANARFAASGIRHMPTSAEIVMARKASGAFTGRVIASYGGPR